MADITINGKSAELWINGRQVLADRVISGTWTKIGTVTLPAFAMGGHIIPDTDNAYDIGSSTKGLKTIYGNDTVFRIRSLVGTAYISLENTQLHLKGGGDIKAHDHFQFTADKGIQTRKNTSGYVMLQGYGSGAFVEHARLAPNNFELVKGLAIGATGLAFSDVTEGVKVATVKTVKVTKAHGSDLFDASALTDSVVIWQQPANSVLLAVKARLETQFAGVTTLKVELGLAADHDGLLDETGDLTADAADTEYKTLGAYWDTLRAGLHYPKTATEDWVAYATSTVENLDQTSAGSIDFYFTYLEL